MAAIYPSETQSIQNKHPHLPPIFQNVNLGHNIQAGDALDVNHLYEARGFQKLNIAPGVITEDVVHTSDLRTTAIENAAASVVFSPANLQQQLAMIQQQLAALAIDCAAGRAETVNAQIRTRNRLVAPDVLDMVPGPGLDLVQAVWNVIDPAAQGQLLQYFNNHPVGPIGSRPPGIAGNIDTLTHLAILKIIFYYNENLGIAAGDGLPERKVAVRRFLNGL
ncbi:hypothetical protein NLJ89_g5986 [Agrocybe chaxingu]|uniref:Uncharacterized protein n=1 Tax=Agrocybe chaxingu TaxID=84603 RepID=A0A9W8K021_9AGAR|nr:hypothetical protein NLJ89_g5986 [Agrocybe chaxingu]